MTTKSDIIKKVVKKHPSLGKVVITAIINKFFKVLSDALKNHNRVEFREFASFSVRSYNLTKVSGSMLDKLQEKQYLKVYFRSSGNLSSLINE
ncbi:MAG: HU family DNA-binding protein [Wolbachia sp.]|nr:HU family DNA-binding protein [Wolbachia sp.]MDD9336144.1 HU family DNA-binding protein [Wolbachia sp.]